MKITFWGAAQTVTGSMHLVECNGYRILLDCGLYQGRRAEAYERNSTFPFNPRTIDAVLLSHAHIDHSGNLPSLVKQGFRGLIYATAATRDLCAIMLADSAHIQESDARFLRKHGKDAADPLYQLEDVTQTMELFHTIPYRRRFVVFPGIEAAFYDAGHILGSAAIAVWLREGDRERCILFTGDVGRPAPVLLRQPDWLPEADVIISESTYGGKTHEPQETTIQTLQRLIERIITEHGKLIIPAFSVGRTQNLVYYLNMLHSRSALADVPIVVDSPLSSSATNVYRLHPECFNPAVRQAMLTDPDPFGFESLRYTRSADESKALNGKHGPMVIISASGMCESGRILHHLRNTIEDHTTTVLLLGFMAEHTLGRRLADGADRVRILGEEFRVRARIEQLHSMSAHADQEELAAYLGQLRGRAETIFLVHGEPAAQTLMAERLREDGWQDVRIPTRGESVEL
ncbi:MAG: MBL fold hydrolase [Candidatus Kapaibacterium sp.]|nr:MAG: MBL fold hydrolase [Candidatus Kapabacteria bacterium]